jgi:hypothetical protein
MARDCVSPSQFAEPRTGHFETCHPFEVRQANGAFIGTRRASQSRDGRDEQRLPAYQSLTEHAPACADLIALLF